jgi:hypothetical protein
MPWRLATFAILAGDGCGGIPFERERPIAGVQNGGWPMTTERAQEQSKFGQEEAEEWLDDHGPTPRELVLLYDDARSEGERAAFEKCLAIVEAEGDAPNHARWLTCNHVARAIRAAFPHLAEPETK